MKYFVYILVSLLNGDIYIGSTADVLVRLRLHNQGKVKSTKGYRPWKLLEIHEYESRGEAVKGERFYKTGQKKEILKRKFGQVAK
ncbi:MAG: GIY-YIG nuclease family protein [Patescibacteria group bacterium]